MKQESTVILQGIEIDKTYKKKDRHVHALDHVSFELREGEILGIVGESGSGKSTLLKMITGMERPDSGQLLYRGEDYTKKSLRHNGSFLQMVFQDAYGSFDPRMSMMACLKESANYTEAEIVEAIKKVGLEEHLLKRKAKHLSGGQCQRMAISRALLRQVPILLCDEITSALDVTTQKQVISLLSQLNEREKLSMIFVSHDIALVSNLCDRIMIMKQGCCVEAGETHQVIATPQHAYTKQLLSSLMEVS